VGLTLLWVCLPSLLFGCGSGERSQVWGDAFEEGPSTLLTDSAFTALQNSMGRSENGPWRVTDVRSSARFLWLPSQGRALAESVMGVPRAVLETPYWTSWFRLHGAVGDGYILAATNLLYPIRIYDQEGLLRDSVTTPPPSWVQARRPTQGEFMPEARQQIREYRQGHTIITGLAAVSEHVFIVAHGRYELDPTGAPPDGLVPRTLWIDVYRDGQRFIADHPSPGEILAHGENVVLFLERKAAEGQWEVTEYSLREDAN
jgi:hypothetical protein